MKNEKIIERFIGYIILIPPTIIVYFGLGYFLFSLFNIHNASDLAKTLSERTAVTAIFFAIMFFYTNGCLNLARAGYNSELTQIFRYCGLLFFISTISALASLIVFVGTVAVENHVHGVGDDTLYKLFLSGAIGRLLKIIPTVVCVLTFSVGDWFLVSALSPKFGGVVRKMFSNK